VLREIEEELPLLDPRLADLMTRLSRGSGGRRARRPKPLPILGASILPTMCMVLAQVDTALVAAVFAVAVLALHRAWVWRPGQRSWLTGWWAE
jgi:hypothetical protein